jgi:hypothetical protein
VLYHPTLDHSGFIGITRTRIILRASRITGRNMWLRNARSTAPGMGQRYNAAGAHPAASPKAG